MIEVEAQIAIKRDGVAFLNPTKMKLLNEIVRSGSLSAAAKSLSVSYQHAWTMINEMNQTAPQPLVLKQRGGNNGGGAELSEYGKRIVKEYQIINETVNRMVGQINVEINL